MRVGVAKVLGSIASAVSRAKRVFACHEDVWVVRGGHDSVDAEPVCARCLQAATSKRREVSPSGASTISVYYCGACLAAFGKREVAHLAWVLASALLGVAGSIFFPLLPWLSQAAAVSGALGFAAIPWLLGQLWLRRQGSPLPRRSAVSLSGEGVICTNQHWARQLARRLGTEAIHKRLRPGILTGWSIAGLVITAVATPVLYVTFHCETRILNLTEQELVVWVDGHRVATVKPTTQEHPRAGVIVRIAMGSRRLQARSHEGALVHTDEVHVAAGQTYLYAPAHPAEVCFWVERTALGRARAGASEREYLPGEVHFWKMPVSIDSWFISAAGSETEFFTGGVVTALRQGPCARAGTVPDAAAAHF